MGSKGRERKGQGLRGRARKALLLEAGRKRQPRALLALSAHLGSFPTPTPHTLHTWKMSWGLLGSEGEYTPAMGRASYTCLGTMLRLNMLFCASIRAASSLVRAPGSGPGLGAVRCGEKGFKGVVRWPCWRKGGWGIRVRSISKAEE